MKYLLTTFIVASFSMVYAGDYPKKANNSFGQDSNNFLIAEENKVNHAYFDYGIEQEEANGIRSYGLRFYLGSYKSLKNHHRSHGYFSSRFR